MYVGTANGLIICLKTGNMDADGWPNPWMGVRVSWTMNNERVWDKTHDFAAILWAAMHIQYNLYGMGFIAATGILFGLARARTGSLLVPMALHAALNFSDLLLFTMNGTGNS